MDPDSFWVSINRIFPAQKLGLPPSEQRWTKYNGSFVAEEHTPASHMEQIALGYGFSAVLGRCSGQCCGVWCTNLDHKKMTGHCGRPWGYRRNQHFASAQFVALDQQPLFHF